MISKNGPAYRVVGAPSVVKRHHHVFDVCDRVPWMKQKPLNQAPATLSNTVKVCR